MFRNKVVLGLMLVVSLGLLAISGWAMGKSPDESQEPAQVEKSQAEVQTEAKENQPATGHPSKKQKSS
ncbi:MAG: hypothetical protein QME81_18150 [bacterium]|nr:hypothetical protein [bacterium]